MPFDAPRPEFAKPAPPPDLKPLPSQVETWLLEPLKAPAFSLPDAQGNLHELHRAQATPLLLTFWTATAPTSEELLLNLQANWAALTSGAVQVFAVNIDEPADLDPARQFAMRHGFPFPVLYATPQIAGIYNVTYRYLFDRRRDLPIPVSFLLDPEKMIVKVYQGPIEISRIMADAQAIPNTPAERMKKAIPFKGDRIQSAFHRNDFTYGVAMFQCGYLDQAAESFQQVVTANPENPDGYYNLGTLSLQRHDLNRASEYLEQAVKLRPNYPEAWNNLGMIAAQQGRPGDAIQSFQQAHLLRPTYATALLNLGNLFRRQGEFAKAEESLQQALQLQPDDPEAHYSLGMLAAQQDRTENAAQYLREAIALRPDYQEALNNLGVLFVRQRNYAAAEEQFRTCIRLVPAFDQSYLNLARVQVLQGEKDQAIESLQELLRLQPDNAPANKAIEMLK